jgi:hypothetical protein
MGVGRTLVEKATFFLIVTSLFILALPAFAQQPQTPSAAGDNPSTPARKTTDDNGDKKDEKTKDDDPDNPKNDRLFLVIPNYTTVEVPTTFTPLTVKQKFKLGAEDAFDPYAFPLAGVLAGFAQAENDDPTWGQGLKGYGKRYAAGYGDTVTGSFMTTGVFPSLFHEDPRYFRKGTGGFGSRSLYALKRMIVTRTDSGGSSFNFSEYVGNAVAAGLSLTYHSREDRTLSSFMSGWGTQIAIDVIANVAKEFWPDIRHKMFKK